MKFRPCIDIKNGKVVQIVGGSLTDISIKYNVHIIYCGSKDNAEEMALSIMKRMVEIYGRPKQD